MEKQNTEVSENERQAIEIQLHDQFGQVAIGSAGNSPYSEEAIVFGLNTVKLRGTRVDFVHVCMSHNGAGKYKGRGRWRHVYLVAQKESGKYATCDASDTDATELNSSGFYIRPWESHEAEQGKTSNVLKLALESLGL